MRSARETGGGSLKVAAVVAAIASGCTVGPDYLRPDAPVPALYKEAGWKVGAASGASAVGGLTVAGAGGVAKGDSHAGR